MLQCNFIFNLLCYKDLTKSVTNRMLKKRQKCGIPKKLRPQQKFFFKFLNFTLRFKLFQKKFKKALDKIEFI